MAVVKYPTSVYSVSDPKTSRYESLFVNETTAISSLELQTNPEKTAFYNQNSSIRDIMSTVINRSLVDYLF